MNNLSKATLILLLSLFCASVTAQETRYYDVEIILFENLDPQAPLSENWPASVELELPPEKVIKIGQPYPGPIPKEFNPKYTFKPLRANEYRLNEQAAKIEESESRRVLLHTGWRQPGMPKDTALSVYFNRQIPAAIPVAENTIEVEGEASKPAWRTPEAGNLEGLIKVILARYLHVSADIVFRPQLATAEKDIYAMEKTEDTIQPVVYRLKQTRRRMRSRELHYLDNPVIGMLIMITPFEPKQ